MLSKERVGFMYEGQVELFNFFNVLIFFYLFNFI